MMRLPDEMISKQTVALLNPVPMKVTSSHFVVCDAAITHYVYTKAISDCVGIGLVLHDPQGKVTNVAMYHSYSEHKEEVSRKLAELMRVNIKTDINSILDGAMLAQSLHQFFGQVPDGSTVDVIVHLENRNGWNPDKNEESDDQKLIEKIINAVLSDLSSSRKDNSAPNIKINYQVQKGGSVFVLFADGTPNKMNTEEDAKQFAKKILTNIEQIINEADWKTLRVGSRRTDTHEKIPHAFNVILDEINKAKKTGDYEGACDKIVSKLSGWRYQEAQSLIPFIKRRSDETQAVYDTVRELLQPYRQEYGVRGVFTPTK